MKKLIVTILTLSLVGLSSKSSAQDTYSGPKSDLHVYLLIGQSNMAGRAKSPDKDAAAIDRCFLLNGKDQWEDAKNPLNRYSTIRKGLKMQKLNPGYSFSKTMLKEQRKISIGLVVNAKGGTRIEQWGKGTKFYKDAIRRTKEAQKSGTLKGVLWHQGESNQKNPEGYLLKLQALVENLRADLNSPDLPFVAGQVINVPAINEQIAQLPSKVPATGFVSSEGLKGQDRWHFDTKSMMELGERYAEAMLKILK